MSATDRAWAAYSAAWNAYQREPSAARLEAARKARETFDAVTGAAEAEGVRRWRREAREERKEARRGGRL